MPLEIKDTDRQLFDQRLDALLPSRIVDIHTHIWLRSCHLPSTSPSRSQRWPSLVAGENPIEDLLQTYALMFPRRQVTPLVFGSPRQDVDLEMTNGYVSQVAGERGLPGLLVSTPAWSVEELERRVSAGGFLGLKPYLSFAPPHIPASEITIFDFLPRSHLQAADANGWIVMLHIPRPGRLRDAVNLEQMLAIDRQYPNAKVITAHIGRAYCDPDVGDAFSVLRETTNIVFDFSANTNASVMHALLETVGPKRVLFGSDLPILRMRMRRICEGGQYVNLVPPGLYGDLRDDPHMREVTVEEGAQLSFFMYEELLAFREAAQAANLSRDDVEDVFYGNAVRLIESAGGALP